MLGKSALRRIENYIFLMNLGRPGTGEARSHPLQRAMERWQVPNLQFDLSLFSHSIFQAWRCVRTF